MPEGDTIYKVAQFMAPALKGHELAQVRLLGSMAPDLARRRVLEVVSWGKHLLITLTPPGEAGFVLRVHLGMHGTWHSYPKGAPMRRPIGADDVALMRDDGHIFVCYRPEDTEVLRVADVPTSAVLGRLGPCLLAEPFDHSALRQRLVRVPEHWPLIDVLLGQHIAAGLGNVYKSELLFLHGLHPLRRKGELTQEALEQIFTDGRLWLKRNLGGWTRTLTYDRSALPSDTTRPNYYVYRRAPNPCSHCGTNIERRLWGRHNRSCYFCPRCQAPPPGLLPSPAGTPHVSRVP